MSGAAHSHESGEHLVAMVNDIGNYFRAQGRDAAIAGIATHIQRYWTPRMRQKLNAYLAQGNSGLDELSRAAVARLNEQAPVGSSQPAGEAGRQPVR
ncbi:MAG: formate dehydrogenase subunit delta [Steroidobacteraceae bacterium]